MQHVVVLAPAAHRGDVLSWLYERREMHVFAFADEGERWGGRFSATGEDTSRMDTEIGHLQSIVSFLREHSNVKPDFLSSLFPVKTIAAESDIKAALEAVNSEEFFEECQELKGEIDAARDERARYEAEAARLGELEFLGVDVERLQRLAHVSVRFVAAGKTAEVFAQDERVKGRFAVEAVSAWRAGRVFAVAFVPGDAETYRQVVADYSLRELGLPDVSGTIGARRKECEDTAARAVEKENDLAGSAAELAGELTACELALAHWESERTRAAEQAKMVSSGNVFAARGYVRAGRLEALRGETDAYSPGATIIEAEAPEGEEPPVSLTWSRFVRPAGLLVRMFGLPKYSTFDPTPFVMFTFLTFFGICFGDLVYGAMLIAVAGFLRRRFARQRHLVEFFRLFTYAGVFTMIFGVLTGSWASDLTMYLGDGNFLDRLRVRLTLLDPLQQPMIALGISVGIGVVNQFYGLVLKYLGCVWRGDYLGGFLDGGLWLIYLVSMLVMSVGLTGLTPESIILPSAAVFVVSALALVLTQGRGEHGFTSKAVTGIVSLYGILGGYGTTSFIGDVLSYSRLLALGLTTSVIGMAFNIIAGFLKQMPVVGIALFVLVVLFGHTFNFVMSILGSFVHPARLMFLEFFGRFYEAGGTAFRPFGFRSATVDLVEKED